MKIRFKLFIILICFIVISFSICLIITKKLSIKQYIQSYRPTLFFHGYGANSKSEEHMTEAFRQAGVTTRIVLAKVSPPRKVTMIGDLSKKGNNPIIKVEFKDNTHPSKVSFYTQSLMTFLNKNYQIDSVNMVGHSMGNLSIWNYIRESLKSHNNVSVKKVVSIGNHVNGIMGFNEPKDTRINPKTGQPNQTSKTYQELLSLRENLPKNRLSVLYIYGNYKNESDGRVSNNSSKSLRFLVKDKSKWYQEIEVKGSLSQHSQLHENPEVNKVIINFLWEK